MHPSLVKKDEGNMSAFSSDLLPDEYAIKPGVDPFMVFDKKVAVHAGLSGKMVPHPDIDETFTKLLDTPRTGKSAAYIHIPFCDTHCLYCGFAGGKYSLEAGDAYIDAVLTQIVRESQTEAVQSSPVHAMYFGGGTPTALSPKQLERLLTTLQKTLPLANDCEITIEGRVHNFTKDKMESCIDAGVNRFSLGVQSFDTGLRRRIGRLDTRETVINTLETLASFDQASIVIDLIYGLPGQSVADWENEIKTFLQLPLDGIDLYQLNVFPNGRLDKAIQENKVPKAALLHEQPAYFEKGVELMENARMRRLSISHWGRTGRERNLYNPLSKSKANCLAYGAGAGGLLHGHFYFQTSKAEDYIAKMNAGKNTVGMLAAPPENMPFVQAVLEDLDQGFLRFSAIDNSVKDAAAHMLPSKVLYPLFEIWAEAGLAVLYPERVELTIPGQFWQVNLTQAILSFYRTSANRE